MVSSNNFWSKLNFLFWCPGIVITSVNFSSFGGILTTKTSKPGLHNFKIMNMKYSFFEIELIIMNNDEVKIDIE